MKVAFGNRVQERVAPVGGRQLAAVNVSAVLRGNTELFEIVLALAACGGFAHFLHGRQQQADQNSDDGYHHQQFNEREGATPTRRELQLLHEATSSEREKNHVINSEKAYAVHYLSLKVALALNLYH